VKGWRKRREERTERKEGDEGRGEKGEGRGERGEERGERGEGRRREREGPEEEKYPVLRCRLLGVWIPPLGEEGGVGSPLGVAGTEALPLGVVPRGVTPDPPGLGVVDRETEVCRKLKIFGIE
jgi:hypothetical protein